MQIVHFTDKAIGSFDWELPEDVASLLSQLPPEGQKVVLHELQQLTKAHLFTMIATLKMGYAAEKAFDLIRDRSAAMSRELIAMAREEMKKKLTLPCRNRSLRAVFLFYMKYLFRYS